MKTMKKNVESFATAKLQAKRQSLLAIIALTALMLFAACDDGSSPSSGGGGVTGVSVSPATLNLFVGDTYTLSATVTPSYANNAVSWASNNTAAASVDTGGVVTAIGEGTAKITVTTEEAAKTAECTVTVEAAPASISITNPPDKTEYNAGEPLDLTGLVVTAAYSEGEPKVVTITMENISGYNPAEPGVQTITVTYGGKTAAFTITVIAVDSVEVINQPNKTIYRRGEPQDFTGIAVIATYSDETIFPIPFDDLTFTGFSSATAGTKTVTVSFGGKSDTFEVEVINVTLSSIEITTPPKTEYFVGENLDLTGMVVTAKFSDTSEEIVPHSALTITGFNSATAGQKTITVTYGTVSKTFNITVTAVTLDCIEVTEPHKTTYFIGEPLDITGMVVTAVYNNGSRVNVSASITVSNISGYNAASEGSQELTVTYNGKPATFDVVVIDPERNLTDLQITTPPSKTTYYQGEELDLTGMVVTAHWGEFNAPLGHGMLEITGFNTALTGLQTLIVSYGEKSAFQDVTVNALVVMSISITAQPSKTTYLLGEALDLGGITVRAVLNSGSNINVNAGDPQLSGTFDNTTAGNNKTVTVTYTNPYNAGDFKTATYDVTVNPFTVTFNRNSGDTDASPATKEVTTLGGNVGTLPGAPTKSGWTFSGWFANTNGTGAEFTAATAVTGNMTVYAKWIATVTFNANGQDGAYSQSKAVVYPATTIDSLPLAPTGASGWTFKNWNTQADGTGTVFTAATTVSGHIEVFAQWKVTVTFNPNGGNWDGDTDNRTVDVDYNTAVGNPGNPARDLILAAGLYYQMPDPIPAVYTFGGWNWNFSDPITAPITLTAQWSSGVPTPIGAVAANNVAAAVTHVNAGANLSGGYTLVIDQEAPVNTTGQTLSRAGNVFTIMGSGGVRTIVVSTNAQLFTVSNGTLKLGKDITLRGGNYNNVAAVYVHTNGTLIMENGSTIRDNTNSATTAQGGGVLVTGANAQFIMNGGTIYGNSRNVTATVTVLQGAGVTVDSGAVFTMNGGTISGNSNFRGGSGTTPIDALGGGVFVGAGSTFSMSSGTISGNSVDMYNGTLGAGGGVYVANGGTFNLSGDAIISGNKVGTSLATISAYGGAVYVGGRFTMNGGTISSNEIGSSVNNSTFAGGGVYVSSTGVFSLIKGTISDNNIRVNYGSVGGSGRQLFVQSGGTATYGTVASGGTDGGILSTTDATINVVDGQLMP